MNGVEQNRAIEDGRRSAREYIRKHKGGTDQTPDPNQQETQDGLSSLDKEKFIKDGPSKYGKGGDKKSDKKPEGQEPGQERQGEKKIQDPSGQIEKGREAKPGEDGKEGRKVEPGKEGGDGGERGWTTPYIKRVVPQGGDGGEGGDPVGPYPGGDPLDPDDPDIRNIDHNEDDHDPGKGAAPVDSLCGEEIFNRINDAVKEAKKNGEDVGIDEITDTIPNKQVSESEKREMMRKLIQAGIDNHALTNGKQISKENPLSIDPTRYCSFPFLDWRKVLEDFLEKIDVQWESNWYGSPYKHGDFKYDLAWRDEHVDIEEGVGHIVISVDTSGSVSEEKITLFLGQVGEVLDAAINDEIIVDVVKSAAVTITVDRFLHRKGQFAKEAKIIRNEGERGGTDYQNSLRYFHYMMMDNDDREKNGYDEFMEEFCPSGIHTIDDSLNDLDMIPPASGYILFTDGDYFSCPKYYGNMEADSAPFEEFVNRTCFFVGLDSYDVMVGNTDVWGRSYEKDPIFGDRTHVCSMKMFWDKCVRRKINESFDMVDFDMTDLLGTDEPTGTQKQTSKASAPATGDGEQLVGVDDIVNDIRNRGNDVDYTEDNLSLINALDTCGLDYKVEKSGLVHIVGDQVFDKDKLTVLAGVHGEPKYVIDGNVILTVGSLAFFYKHMPDKDNGTIFCFKDNEDIEYKVNGDGASYYNFIEKLPDSMKYRVKYVNCRNITQALIEENDADGIQSNVKAFSNDANLVIPYIKKYIEDLIEIDKKYANAGFVIKYKNDINAPYKTYEDGENIAPGADVYLCPAKRTLISFDLGLNGPNSKSYNKQYGYNRFGFPPFISVMCDDIIIDGDPKPLRSVDEESLQHIGNLKINN